MLDWYINNNLILINSINQMYECGTSFSLCLIFLQECFIIFNVEVFHLFGLTYS